MNIRRLLKGLASLGWFYDVGLAVATGALVGFAKLADEVLEGDVHPVNVAVLRGLHAPAARGLDTLAVGLSRLGDSWGTTAVGALGVVIFARRGRLADVVTLIPVLLGGITLSVVLKHSFRLPRPELFISIAPESGYGFPCAHALMSVCLYGFLAAVLVLDGPGRPWRLCGAGALVFIAVGITWSRLYLGVHWLSDVVAGVTNGVRPTNNVGFYAVSV